MALETFTLTTDTIQIPELKRELDGISQIIAATLRAANEVNSDTLQPPLFPNYLYENLRQVGNGVNRYIYEVDNGEIVIDWTSGNWTDFRAPKFSTRGEVDPTTVAYFMQGMLDHLKNWRLGGHQFPQTPTLNTEA
jgi:hypothetical protein